MKNEVSGVHSAFNDCRYADDMMRRALLAMMMATAPAVALAQAGPHPRAVPPVPPRPTVSITTMTIHERIILRVPRVAGPAPAMIRWTERRGPQCVATSELAGALVSEPGAIDLVLLGGTRVRARLDSECAPLDFYGGFYLRPSADGLVCAGRDALRARSGVTCGIVKYRGLKARR